MGILSWILMGFIVGLLARAILPGRQPMGVVATTLLGMAGSVAGGLVVSLFTHRHIGYHRSGWIGSIIGAVVLLFIYVVTMRRMHLHRTEPTDRPATV
jgi:uncharacterized membrane protein YeaQ/YmgE (transglycosylase-associated protein family)